MKPAIEVKEVSKMYRLGQVGSATLKDDLVRGWNRLTKGKDPFADQGQENDRTSEALNPYVWALKDINFEVMPGEVMGLIGKNGAGKSTLLKILSRVTTPSVGEVLLRGRVSSLLEVGTGFHPELTGRENIFLNGAILGMRRAEIQKKFDEIVAFAGVEKYVNTPVKRYSSGMYVRLAFAVAAHLEPEILIVDEVLAVGDTEFQKKCLGKMKAVSQEEGRTVLFVSHNMNAIRQLCSRCVVLKNGIVQAIGESNATINNYLATFDKHLVQKEWDEHSAPGNEKAKLRSLALSYVNGDCPRSGLFEVSKDIVLRATYEVKEHMKPFSQSIEVFNEEDVHLFSSHDVTNPLKNIERPSGVYIAEVIIPSNLLNEGKFSVSFFLFYKAPFEIIAQSEKTILFSIVDEMTGDSARGDYTQGWPGMFRPLLKWNINKL